MIDVCICTHGGERATMERVLRALAEQTLPKSEFRVVVVDNANTPELKLEDPLFAALQEAGVATRVVREPTLGVAHARIRALRETDGAAVVFVDDDNVLTSDFLERAKKILTDFPVVGCFSGRIQTPGELEVPDWVRPMLGSLAVRDEGDAPIVDWFRGDWKPWVPAATASMVLRREVAEAFLNTHAQRKEFSEFGRRGRGLMSGEDYFIALSAADAGFQCGYFPELLMIHWLRPDRFAFTRMVRLMASYGVTELKRELYLKQPAETFDWLELRARLLAKKFEKDDLRARLCLMAYEIVYVAGRSTRLLLSGKPVWKGRKQSAGE